MEKAKKLIQDYGVSRFIVTCFAILLLVVAFLQGQDMNILFSDIINRFGMYAFFSLAMVPSIISGTLLNFGITLGILAGVLAGLISLELGMTGLTGIGFALALAIPFGVIVGFAYGLLLNKVKGSEMVVATYVGYAAVYIMCIGWMVLPFKNPAMVWAIGGEGLRTTITLDGYYDAILSGMWNFQIGGVTIQGGMIAIIALACFIVYLFTRSKMGIAMRAAGANPIYASAVGVNVNKQRIIGTILSTVLGALGIIIYAQAFGFYQLYTAPMNMSMYPVAAVLIGGATTRKIKISHVLLGTVLYQTIITVAVPVASILVPDGGLGDVVRIIVSNGIILYALAQAGGNK
ncbi:MAG: ABC transporter permease [Oscillospiraceae bacterium]|nr:ABC transporter permease [Oscillospiraceae bacterium]